jgi:hypothetical protein
MGIWRRRDSSRRKSVSPIVIDRKVIRFRRLVEQHGAILDLFADLQDKQSGEYILDRQYIEARLDRAYEGVRRILYDMHVVSDSGGAEGYDDLDRLRAASEKIFRDASEDPVRLEHSAEAEAEDWETLALQSLFQDLTRVPSFGVGTQPGTEQGLPKPGSLTEWAGWGHLKAVQWITDHLPRVSEAPSTSLATEEEGCRVQIFLLGGARDTEDKLARCPGTEVASLWKGSSLLPLRTFLEGLLNPTEGQAARRMAPEKGNKRDSREPAAQLHLYAGEDFLLLRLPDTLPLRLFWCSLSLQPSENMIYLYGTHVPSVVEQGSFPPVSSEKEPFPVYRCHIAGHWMYWASQFSWAQGEERVRMLGDALAAGMTALGGEGTQERIRQCLQAGIAGFLRQTAMPARVA